MTLSTKNYTTIYDLKTALTARREELGFSVKELGKRASVSYTVIYDFEIRGIIPKIETLFKLAKVLELDLNITLGNCVIKEEKNSPFDIIKLHLYILGFNNEDVEDIMRFIKFKGWERKNPKITIDDFPEEIEY